MAAQNDMKMHFLCLYFLNVQDYWKQTNKFQFCTKNTENSLIGPMTCVFIPLPVAPDNNICPCEEGVLLQNKQTDFFIFNFCFFFFRKKYSLFS